MSNGAHIAAAKRALRRQSRATRARLTDLEVTERSAAICNRLLPLLSAARDVALFWPMAARNEVDLRPLDAELRSAGKRLYYPYMAELKAGAQDCFRHLNSVEAFELHPTGFLQPPPSAPQAAQLDAIVVPALAVTAQGERLGYGAGYYDRRLAAHPSTCAVCVVYDFEVVENLPTDPLDRPVRFVVTDRRCFGPFVAVD